MMLGCPEWLLACCYAVAKVTWVLTATSQGDFLPIPTSAREMFIT